MSNNSIVPDFDDDKDESLAIDIATTPSIKDCVVFSLNGYIDTNNSIFFQKQVTKVVEKGFLNLVFNCTSLSYVSSTGIGSFSTLQKMIKPKGGELVLLGIQPKIFEVFQLLGFSQFFVMKDTMDEVVALFNEKSNGETSVFPKIFECPVCSKKLKATKSGRFRCSDCKSIIAIDEQGNVALN